MILQLLILSQMLAYLAYLAPVVADAGALIPYDERNCTEKVPQGSVVFEIRYSGTHDIINIYAKGTYVAHCDTGAALMEPVHQDYYHVSLTARGSCLFMIYNFDGNIFNVNITSETRNLTGVSIQGTPITNCFRPSFVEVNLTDNTNCTVRVPQGSVVFEIRSSDTGLIKIQANGTYVAYCDTKAELSQPDLLLQDYHVSLTPRGSCVFIIYNYDGNISSVNITSETRNLTEVSIQGTPITNCFRPSSVVIKLKGEEKCHQQEIGTVCKVGVPDWAVVLLVILPVVIIVAIVHGIWRRCKRGGMDQNHVKERRNSGDTDTHVAETLLENGNTKHQPGKPGTERHDSNGSVKKDPRGSLEQISFANDNKGRGWQDSNDAVNGKPGWERHDNNATGKGKPGRGRQDSNETGKGKPRNDRQDSNATGKSKPRWDRQDSNATRKGKPRWERQDSNETGKGNPRRERQDNNETGKGKPRWERQDSNETGTGKPRCERQDNNETGKGKPRWERQDSNETGKGNPRRERLDSNETGKGKPRRKRQDSNGTGKGKPRRKRQDSNETGNGKPRLKRQDSNEPGKGKLSWERQDSNVIGKGKLRLERQDSIETCKGRPRLKRQESNETGKSKPGWERKESNEPGKGKPGRVRQDSNGAFKGRHDSNDAVKGMPGSGRQDSNDAVNSEFHDKFGKNKKGKRKIDRNATAKDGHRDNIPQQSFRMSTRKTQRNFGPSEPVLRNRFQVLVEPV